MTDLPRPRLALPPPPPSAPCSHSATLGGRLCFQACAIVLRAKPFLAPGAIMVITLKLVWQGKDAHIKGEAAARKALHGQVEEGLEVLWLFSNTMNERTVVARLRA